MGSYSAEFTKTYTTGTYTPTVKVRITVEDSDWDSTNRTSKVTLKKVEYYSSVIFSTVGMPLIGRVTLNGTTVADFQGGSADTVAMTNTYRTADYGTGTYGNVTVSHDDTGAASVTIGVDSRASGDWSSSHVFGAWAYTYDNSKLYGVDKATVSKPITKQAAKTYTVSYNANGGSGAPAAQTKTYNVALTLSSTKPSKSTSTDATYTITYNYNGNGQSSTTATASKTTSYSFSKWNTAANGSGTSYNSGGSYTANAAATLYAQWTSSTSTSSVTLPSPTRTGYTFAGWYDAASGGTKIGNGGASYTPTATKTLYAHWTVNSYTATFTAGTNVASASGGGSKNYGASVTATATLSTATGYHFSFDGWYSGTQLISTANPYTFTMPANDVSYTARATKTANTYTVKFNKNNSSATGSTGDESFTYDAAKALTSNGFSLTGYDFKGWAETASGAVKYTDGQSVKNLTTTNGGTVNLYAVWEIKHYSVSYNANSGSSTPDTQTFDYGGSVKLSAAISRSNASAGSYTVTYKINYSGGTDPTAATAARTTKYTFSGWKASTNSTVYSASSTYSKNASVTMTAQWSSTTTTAAVTLPSPTRTGYTFKGWSTSSSATTGSTGSYTPTGNVTLYAIWQLKTYTLSISQGTGSTISVARGGTALANGATISHFDVLTISISANTGYNLGTHTVNGSTWTSGSQLTVSGAVAVVSSATKKTYTLTVTKSSTGVVVNVNRSSSPIGGGSIGLLSSGATLYYNDVIKVSYEKNAGYNLTAATVNGTTIPVKSTNIGETANITVTANQVVVVTVEQGAVMYIGNGTSFDQYQIFIGDGTNWNQYQAYIGDGTNWVAY